MIVPHWFFQVPNKYVNNIPRRINNSKPLVRPARDKVEKDSKQLNTEAAKNVNISCSFVDRIVNTAFNVTLDGHHINHVNSKKHLYTKLL